MRYDGTTSWRGFTMQRVLLLFAAIAWAFPSAAQTTNGTSGAGDPMTSLCTGLLTESGSGITAKDKLCSCLINGVTSKLSADEMTAYAEANLNSQTPPPGVMDKVMGIATSCLNQAQ